MISAADLTACLELLRVGAAVDLEFAAAELPRALRVAVVRAGATIVAVAAIKRPRPQYAIGVAKKSGFAFSSEVPELVSADGSHPGGVNRKHPVGCLVGWA